MAFAIADRVQETTTTTGTGTVVLAGAVTGYQSFAVIGNNNTTYYTIADQLSIDYIPHHKHWRLNERHYGAL